MAELMSTQWDNINIEDEEGGLILEEEEIRAEVNVGLSKLSLIGRFHSDRPINEFAMKNTLASIWRPVKGVHIKEAGNGAYVFQFFHEKDLERVVQGGPWTFNNNLLLTKAPDLGIIPSQMVIREMEIWVQAHDIPIGFMSDKVAQHIGSFIGQFLESDPRNYGSCWRNFLRIRVSMDIQKPLRRRMKMKKQGGDWFWVQFKYERLPQFCFHCGLVGHTNNFCEKAFDNPSIGNATPYDISLRATNRNQGRGIGDRWLREEGVAVARDGGKEVMEGILQSSNHALFPKHNSGNQGNSSHNDSRISCNKEGNVNVMPTMAISLNVDKSVEELEESGVLILDGKKRKVVEVNGPGKEPMIVEIMDNQKNGPEVGLVDQACLSQ